MEPAFDLRAARRDKLRREIARIGWELIRSRGYESTSVDQVAARALISTRTFYRYFGSKEELVSYGLPDPAPQLAEKVADADVALPRLLGGVVDGLDRAFGDRSDPQARDRLAVTLSTPPLLGQYVERQQVWTRPLGRTIARRSGAGPAARRSGQLMAAAIAGALQAALRQWADDETPLSLRDSLAQALELLQPALEALEGGGASV